MSFVETIRFFDTVPSTMAVARQCAERGDPEGTTVVARAQTTGRGRRGRSWFSPQGGVYMTTVLMPVGVPSERLSQLALVAGLSTRATCEQLGASGARVKWPNDVLVGRKKLAGVLLEAQPGPGPLVLVGIGLNLAAREHVRLDEAISRRYVGLHDLIEGEPSAETVSRTLLEQLEEYYREWLAGGWSRQREEFERYHALTGDTVWAQSDERAVDGVVSGLDENGALILETNRGPVRVSSGEVERVRFRRSGS